MKRIKVLLLILASILIVSCSKPTDFCYYLSTTDNTSVLVYSSSKNTLYDVDIPKDKVEKWGELNSYKTFKDSLVSYVGLSATDFIFLDNVQESALYDLVDSIAEKNLSTTEERLEVVLNNANLLSNSVFLNNMNKLTSADLGDLSKVLIKEKPEICILDATSFLPQDVQLSQKYFRQWINQVLQ